MKLRQTLLFGAVVFGCAHKSQAPDRYRLQWLSKVTQFCKEADHLAAEDSALLRASATENRPELWAAIAKKHLPKLNAMLQTYKDLSVPAGYHKLHHKTVYFMALVIEDEKKWIAQVESHASIKRLDASCRSFFEKERLLYVDLGREASAHGCFLPGSTHEGYCLVNPKDN